MKRKIIQISVSAGNENISDWLYALCDDGTIWTTASNAIQWTEISTCGIPEYQTWETKETEKGGVK